MKKSNQFLAFIPLIIFLVFYAAINTYNIVTKPTPFYDWDESIYMQAGREMFHEKSLVPLWQGHPWLEKPPLIPFIFGITTKLPFPTEITARLISLAMTILVLMLLYLWAMRILKNTWLSVLAVIITAFNPIFVQRAQVVNGDTFLLAGWLGTLLFASNFWLSFVFLFLGVMSKSLLGFYPVILLALYYLYRSVVEKKKKELRQVIPLLVQSGILAIWYLVMFVLYRGTFLEMHFQDHLLRRVTQSVESHFGQRTFYIDIIVTHYGWFLILAAISLGILIYDFLKKKLSSEAMLTVLFLAPWFIFLNLTKTKISWYLYPAVPLFPILMVYLFSRIKNNFLTTFLSLMAIGMILYSFVLSGDFFQGSYSQFDAYFRTAKTAGSSCKTLSVLVSPTDRQTHDTLKKMHLLLSTTEWYDSHPGMVYYAGIPTEFVYDKEGLRSGIGRVTKQGCVAMEQTDADLSLENKGFSLLETFKPLLLFKRN